MRSLLLHVCRGSESCPRAVIPAKSAQQSEPEAAGGVSVPELGTRQRHSINGFAPRKRYPDQLGDSNLLCLRVGLTLRELDSRTVCLCRDGSEDRPLEVATHTLPCLRPGPRTVGFRNRWQVNSGTRPALAGGGDTKIQ